MKFKLFDGVVLIYIVLTGDLLENEAFGLELLPLSLHRFDFCILLLILLK